MAFEPVRYYEFTGRLRDFIQGTPRVEVWLRVDGRLEDPNVILVTDENHAEWRVGPRGLFRSDSWNMAGMICQVTTSNGQFPHVIQAVYENALNVDRQGWVVLTVENGLAVAARRCQQAPAV